jgi:hypothetical protein
MPRIIALSEQSLHEYFFDTLRANSQRYSLDLTDDTHAYLVNLSIRFLHSEQLFLQDEYGLSLPTLAFLYRDALAVKNERDRHNLVRTLGDTALFLAACFPDVWQRRGLSRSYFIDMGESAFDTLIGLDRERRFPYQHLANDFEAIANCLGLSVFNKPLSH